MFAQTILPMVDGRSQRASGPLQLNFSPLPWRERVGGEGECLTTLIGLWLNSDSLPLTPTPPSRGEGRNSAAMTH